MKALAGEVAKIARPVLGRRGLGEAQLLKDWPAIVGRELAEGTLPVKLAFPKGERINGILHLRADSAAALAVQHLEPQIIERINGFFGYRAVVRLAVRHGQVTPMTPPRPPPPRGLEPAEAADLAQRLAVIEDPDLRAAMDRLGRAILGQRPTGRRPGGSGSLALRQKPR